MNSDRKLFANGSVSNCGQSGRLSIIYGNRPALDGLRRVFKYIFDGNYPWGGVSLIKDHLITRR